MGSEYALVLAKSCFYTNYMSHTDINQFLAVFDDKIASLNVENVRFCSMIKFLNGQQDVALKYLMNYGGIKDSIQGQLFLATVQRMGKKYTNSIINYKEALAKTADGKIQKLIHVNLGKIYFTQGLYRESLDQFMLALKIDDMDSAVKIWLGKNYSALGDKAKAKTLWGEVLNVDKTNAEVKNLLGIM
jgi:tetratricopeptide (TPR) repeat protein